LIGGSFRHWWEFNQRRSGIIEDRGLLINRLGRCVASNPSGLHAFLAVDLVIHADLAVVADPSAAIDAGSYSVFVRMLVASHGTLNMRLIEFKGSGQGRYS